MSTNMPMNNNAEPPCRCSHAIGVHSSVAPYCRNSGCGCTGYVPEAKTASTRSGVTGPQCEHNTRLGDYCASHNKVITVAEVFRNVPEAIKVDPPPINDAGVTAVLHLIDLALQDMRQASTRETDVVHEAVLERLAVGVRLALKLERRTERYPAVGTLGCQIFVSHNVEQLNAKINEWFRVHPKDRLVDMKYSSDDVTYSALLIHREGPEELKMADSTHEIGKTMPLDTTKLLNPQTLREDGYLQEVNRKFFHPLGLALGIDTPSNALFVIDYREDPEGITFADEIDLKDKAARLEQIKAERRDARVSKLGYWFQPI